MKVTMYGTHLCQYVIHAISKIRDYDDIIVKFRNITANLDALNEYFVIREGNPEFDRARANGGIGVPYFIFEDGTTTFDYKEVIKRYEETLEDK